MADKQQTSEGATKSTRSASDAGDTNDLTALLSHVGMSEDAYREFAQPARALSAAASSGKGTSHPSVPANRTESPASSDRDQQTASRHTRMFRRLRQRDNRQVVGAAGVPSEGTPTTAAEIDELLNRATGTGLSRQRTHSESISKTNEAVDSVNRVEASPATHLFPPPPRDDSRWSLLGRVLGRETADEQQPIIQAISQTISVPAVLVCSVSGGTGKTTLLAHLGRALSLLGERVLLLTTECPSIVPYFFGGSEGDAGETQSFLALGSPAGLDVLSLPAFGHDRKVHRKGTPERQDRWLEILREMAAPCQRVLVGMSSIAPIDIAAATARTQSCLIPLVPDLNCALAVTRLEDALMDNTSTVDSVYYVFNKFDSSLSLHRDMRACLQEKLGARLLGTTIRRSDAIPEALAEGMTVIDYSPEAGVAEDFVKLAIWLRNGTPQPQADDRSQ
jgi:cellulose synthase operon protein YhjQ